MTRDPAPISRKFILRICLLFVFMVGTGATVLSLEGCAIYGAALAQAHSPEQAAINAQVNYEQARARYNAKYGAWK
jgi:hypothetical protein